MTKISVNYSKPVDKLLEKLKPLLNKGDSFIGDNNSGNFHIKSAIGNFKGNYNVKNAIITIELQKKPFLISSKIIENEIKKYLANN